MFSFSSIAQYHSELAEGNITCLQAAEHYLKKIEATRQLNAFVEVYAEEILSRARGLDEKRIAGQPPGRLHGVIIALKDVIAYKDHHLTAASNILRGFTSLYSATAVERLIAEEALIIGSCNCDEFAMGSTNENSTYGSVLNAIDKTRVPGGSSGGSAVAVQAGLCMVSLGSDTGGSVRQPADYCGIIGLKPTYGQVSRYGLIAYASSFDQIGIFGTTIPDVSLAFEVISGPDDFDSTMVQQTSKSQPLTKSPYRIAYFPEALDHSSLDPEIGNSIRGLLEKLGNAGHQVSPVSFDLIDYVVPAYYVLTTAEASSNLSRFDGVRYGHRSKEPVNGLDDFYKASRSEGFGWEVKRRIMLGTFVLSAGYFDAYFTRAQKVRNLLTNRINLIFKEFDFIILPTSPSTAVKIGASTGDPIAMYLADIYTVMANLTGIPAISLPLFWHNNGLPFGLQVMARPLNEVSLQHFADLLIHEYKTNQI
ncbi:MAG: Asp-tRNA(Asn)/Glu-tRNA(Gln) amidotransferase subunit GatA [Chitinophagaceae bacterium]|nr:Asp-tRNA(Asn)/Glu-tRNA(Gln) amidotransferase subunit GatA [Chitinophagaceae bacterium]